MRRKWMFDPEQVARYDNGPSNYALTRDDAEGDYVAAEDYDQLLALYRKAIAGRESFAKGMMTMRQHDPQTP